MGSKRPSRSKTARPRSSAKEVPIWAVPPLIFLWTVLVHATFLIASVHRASPEAQLFVGESRQILELATDLAVSGDFQQALGLQTPLTIWLMVALRRLVIDPSLLPLAAKAAMVCLNGIFFSLLYIPLREHMPRLAAPLCFLMPLSFGEILLSSAASSDVVYRLLLLIIVTLGWRWPLLAGALHALAVSAHLEHLPFVVVIGVLFALRRPERRRNIAIAGTAFTIFLTGWAAMGWQSRPPRVEVLADGLDSQATEITAIASRGFTERWLSSFGAATYGWTWRDFPKHSTWIREPGDLAHSRTRWYAVAALALIVIGISRLHRERDLLLLAALLVSYRLVAIAFGAPPILSMMICAPVFSLFLLTGAASLLGRFMDRGLLAAIVILALMHLPSAWRPRRYLEMERGIPSKAVPGERPVTLIYQGHWSE